MVTRLLLFLVLLGVSFCPNQCIVDHYVSKWTESNNKIVKDSAKLQALHSTRLLLLLLRFMPAMTTATTMIRGSTTTVCMSTTMLVPSSSCSTTSTSPCSASASSILGVHVVTCVPSDHLPNFRGKLFSVVSVRQSFVPQSFVRKYLI